MNLNSSKYYINRELSWISFNERVLEEAQNPEVPLLERLKFLSICSSNLDEFFMVRVAKLRAKYRLGMNKKDPSGLTPKEQLDKISQRVHQLVENQYDYYSNILKPELYSQDIRIQDYKNLNKRYKQYFDRLFNNLILGVLTPIAIDEQRLFPLIANKTLNIAIRLSRTDKDYYAVLEVPSILPRIIKIPNNKCDTYILLEDIIINNISKLFKGYKVISVGSFRLTRDSDLNINEVSSEELLEEIKNSIKQRKWGAPIRLEVNSKCDKSLIQFLTRELDVDKRNVYVIKDILDLTICLNLYSMTNCLELKYQAIVPSTASDFLSCKDMFKVISKKDCFVHHPYESFDCVLKFVETAANDPEVLAIKQTLYRVSGDSPVVKALIKAAENGKQVTVLVELKARFDEENNINWAKKLEEAGCHVIYGLVGYKIHCKTILVIRREKDSIREYVHMETGNYNDSTAKFYTDMGLFTSNKAFAKDINILFNIFTGFYINKEWNKLIVSPMSTRDFIIDCIENETLKAQNGKKAKIIAKMNSLVDKKIIQSLYKASRAGVKIILLVRGICCLKSGIKGISDNIKVVSIVGRFLEHSRIFYFENNGNNDVYLSSADWMPRNLDKRIEIIFPVEQLDIKQRIVEILEIMINDNTNARIQLPDGSYKKKPLENKVINSQMLLYYKTKQSIKE